MGKVERGGGLELPPQPEDMVPEIYIAQWNWEGSKTILCFSLNPFNYLTIKFKY